MCSGGTLKDRKSTYNYNAGIYGGVYSLYNVNATIIDVKIENSFAKQGGSFYIVDSTNL